METIEYNGKMITLNEALRIIREAQSRPHQFDYEFVKQVNILAKQREKRKISELKTLLNQL